MIFLKSGGYMIKMKASVIVAAYNEEKYISKCLESIRNQDFPLNNLEVVVVDDGSTDNTEKIVMGYEGLNIRYFKQSNEGIAVAWNNAMSKSTGEIYLFVDGDDFITENCVSRCVKSLDNHPEIGMVYSQHARTEEDGTIIKIQEKPEWDKEVFRNSEFNFVGHVKGIRSEVAKSQEFDPFFKYSQSRDWMMRLADSGVEFKYISEMLYFWRKNPGSIGQVLSDQDRKRFSKLTRDKGLRVNDAR